MRFSILTKVLLAVSLSLILIFVFIAYILVRQNTDRLRSSLNEQSKSFAQLATPPIGDTFALYKDSGRIRVTQQVDNFLELDPDITSINIVSVNGSELYGSGDSEGLGVDGKLSSSFEPQYITNQRGYIKKIIQPYFEGSGAHRYSIVYSISTERVEQNVNEVVKLIIYAGTGVLIITIASTGFLLNRFFIRPLRDVSRSANIISSGDLDHKITARQQDEIGDLAASVEKMADYLKADIVKLRELDKLKSEFMMIASHNLRTPITIMQGYIDLAESTKSTEELKGIIHTIEESVVRLHLLAENVLTISTLETGKVNLRKTPTPLKDFINSIDKEFGLLAKKKNLTWNFANKVPGQVELNVSSANMRSALGNLIDNSIKFTKSGGRVSVDSQIIDNQLMFKVSDSGIGIKKEEMPKLFTKFHRGTSIMSYDYEGLGIGLYLTNLIVQQHGGKIEVRSELNKGTTFTVYLPVSSPGRITSDSL